MSLPGLLYTWRWWLGGAAVAGVGYLVLKPAEGAGTKPPALPPGPKVPVTAADLGKTLVVDFSAFKLTNFSGAPVRPTPERGPFRLLGGSIGPDGVLSRVDGSYTFPEGSIAFGSVPPEAVLSVGSILPSVPSVPGIPIPTTPPATPRSQPLAAVGTLVVLKPGGTTPFVPSCDVLGPSAYQYVVDSFEMLTDGRWAYHGHHRFFLEPSKTFTDADIALVCSATPTVPNLIPAGFFPDLAVGDVVLVDAARANVPGIGGALMKIDMLLSDRNLVSAQTYPVKTFSGTIPRDAILQVVSKAGQPFPGVSV
jgi:hypothetical protein